MTPLKLWHEGRLIATISTDSELGKTHFRSVSADANFLSPRQFRVFRDGDGWSLAHSLDAINETLCDGKPVVTQIALSSGMTISVGNSAKGIVKFPLVVDLKVAVDSIPRVDVRATETVADREPAESVIVDKRPAVDAYEEVHELAPRDRDSPPAPLPPSPGPAEPGINWGGLALSALGAIADAIASTGSDHASVYEGPSKSGPIILTVKNNKVYQGNSTFNKVLATIDEERIYRGTSTFLGEVLAHVDGNKVIKGNFSLFGDVVARIQGNQVIVGDSLYGEVIATVDNGGRMAAAAAAVYLLLM